jgi:hypothetical protein
MQRLVSGLDRAAIIASIAGAVLWIEHGHRIDIEPGAGMAFAASVARVCPESENVPYSADCIAFMDGDNASNVVIRVNAERGTPAGSAHRPGSTESADPACPANNENVPYSADCLRFLSGWFWRPHVPDSAAPVAPR